MALRIQTTTADRRIGNHRDGIETMHASGVGVWQTKLRPGPQRARPQWQHGPAG
jgi:hypothetical protein